MSVVVMTSFEEFNDGVKKLIDTLETIIRGGTCDFDLVHAKIEQTIRWISSDEASEALKLTSDSKKKDLITLAVKMNTKARTLMPSTSNSIGKLRTLAKILSGLIVFHFHEPTVKAIQVIIPILSGSVTDLDKDDIKLICCQVVSRSWDALNDLQSASSSLSPVQLHDLKIHVFESLSEESRLRILLKRDETFQLSFLALTKAIEIANTLEVIYSISLTEKCFAVSSLLGNIPLMLDQAKRYYLLTMNIIQLIRNREDYKEVKPDALKFISEIRIRTSLALAYIDMESG